MARKLALKRLTASDLTVFRWHFINRPAGNQKAINLDRSVLVDSLFPELAKPGAVPNPRYNLELKISGPGSCAPHTLVRKILKQQKNWRLNGEFIDGPIDDPQRYNCLAADDFAFFEFRGDQVPEAIHMLLVSAADPQDAQLHHALSQIFVTGSMRVIDEHFIHDVLERSGVAGRHALSDWAEGALLEEIGLGSAAATLKLYARRNRRGLTPEEFLEIRDRAQSTGISGERYLNDWLLDLQREGECSDVEWTSSSNAIAPYDFRLRMPPHGVERRIDAKSTTGEFETALHMSRAEIIEAVRGGVCYDIYRLYRLSEEGAEMRAAYDVGPALAPILKALENLPLGISVDSISIDPRILQFTSDVHYPRNSELDDDEVSL
ncbi:DUF3883 domain-containing protein [Stenotrophomonas sp. MA5]|jgi:hypothetical protein|uniref:protein NO VEIN domain-containing protein n=1 Tax=Stenotrophomonas sp. MA5 TaxID=2508572 RepID=UPI00100999DD|nr:DUF3883 domain-containing protein [Stenotrophomonas sp. MA5]RXK68823.1 DUF3883 domain-containing protein [Stenotrophomonas sp. MA5]